MPFAFPHLARIQDPMVSQSLRFIFEEFGNCRKRLAACKKERIRLQKAVVIADTLPTRLWGIERFLYGGP